MDCVAGKNPPDTLDPVQELQPFCQLLTELQQSCGPTLDILHKHCKDNQEKDVKIKLVEMNLDLGFIFEGMNFCWY